MKNVLIIAGVAISLASSVSFGRGKALVEEGKKLGEIVLPRTATPRTGRAEAVNPKNTGRSSSRLAPAAPAPSLAETANEVESTRRDFENAGAKCDPAAYEGYTPEETAIMIEAESLEVLDNKTCLTKLSDPSARRNLATLIKTLVRETKIALSGGAKNVYSLAKGVKTKIAERTFATYASVTGRASDLEARQDFKSILDSCLPVSDEIDNAFVVAQ